MGPPGFLKRVASKGSLLLGGSKRWSHGAAELEGAVQPKSANGNADIKPGSAVWYCWSSTPPPIAIKQHPSHHPQQHNKATLQVCGAATSAGFNSRAPAVCQQQQHRDSTRTRTRHTHTPGSEARRCLAYPGLVMSLAPGAASQGAAFFFQLAFFLLAQR